MMTGMITGDILQVQRINWLYRISRVIGLMVLSTLAIPLLLGILFSVPITRVFALVRDPGLPGCCSPHRCWFAGRSGSPAGHRDLGRDRGHHGIMEICDLFSDSSERVGGWLRSVEGHIERFQFRRKTDRRAGCLVWPDCHEYAGRTEGCIPGLPQRDFYQDRAVTGRLPGYPSFIPRDSQLVPELSRGEERERGTGNCRHRRRRAGRSVLCD